MTAVVELKLYLERGHFPFKSEVVNVFVNILIHFIVSNEASFDAFDSLLSETDNGLI